MSGTGYGLIDDAALLVEEMIAWVREPYLASSNFHVEERGQSPDGS
jgi:hypothetical protein